MLNIISHQGNVNQSHKRYHLPPLKMAMIKKKKKKCWQGCGEIENLLSIYPH